MKFLLFAIYLLGHIAVGFSQNFLLKGKILNQNYEPIEDANVYIKEFNNLGTTTNKNGYFELNIKNKPNVTVVISHVEYTDTAVKVNLTATQEITVLLSRKIRNLPDVVITEKVESKINIEKLDPKIVNIIPDASGGIEATLKSLPGVSKTNELSNQYSVRGGNFDENLVYVNNIEVFRPTLIRSGQQEGLSFVNTDMVSKLYFSAGGFSANYGDKMSSVLDVEYKKPTNNSISFMSSLLGLNLTLENCSKNYRFTQITGIRYKTSQYLLKTLDTKGDYKPNFFDIQSFITYDITEKSEINFLFNIAQNHYRFIPETRETSFGTIDEALKLKIYFDGQEKDKYTTSLAAISLKNKFSKNFNLTNTVSFYYIDESEKFDILGQYFLNELDKQLGSNSLGDSLMNIGIGTFLNHARNYLNSFLTSYQMLAEKIINENSKIQCGVNLYYEKTKDNIHEWIMLDSAGYSLPYTDSIVGIYSLISGKNEFIHNKYSFFAQYHKEFKLNENEVICLTGIRNTYSSYSNEMLVSPRFTLFFKPANKDGNVVYKFSTGYYYQPLSYKEVRTPSGKIAKNLTSQKSIHYVLGGDYIFKAWNRPFRYIVELFYKSYTNLIPYQIDNVRIQYLGKNNARGYAVGLDMKIHGDFVPGVQSWASLSIMKTKEDILDDYYYKNESGKLVRVEPGYIPRPTDQLINLGIFFQDYLPIDPTYTMQLSLLFGSGLPFGPPKSERYQAIYRMPPYRRVDIGFAKIIVSPEKRIKEGLLKYFSKLWLGIEVFNLLDINNTVSYQWVSDIRGHEYAVPNYLSSRMLNLKIIASF
jgi:hypothetical protein